MPHKTTRSSKNNHNKKQTLFFWTLPLCLLLSTAQVQAIKMGQAISTTQFFLCGRRHFTAPGHARRAKKCTAPVQNSPAARVGQEGADGADLTDKVVVIAGANGGLGKELAMRAAAKGATLCMICRSQERAKAARQDISKATQACPDKIQILQANVGELSQVRSAVKELQAKESKVDCLVCNAGASLNKRTETSEGHEVTFASHLLGGSHLLSQLSVPQLKTAEKG